MLDPEATWVNQFKALSPQATAVQGIMQLANTIEALTNKVEANLPGGKSMPGIFTWNKGIFIAQAAALTPVPGPTWIPLLAGAWTAACAASVITPGTVTYSGWTVSSKDVNTLPSAAVTIPTISAATTILEGLLAKLPVDMQSNPTSAPGDMAKAFRTATLAFVFNLIGISGTIIAPVPLPLPAKAQ